MKQFDVCRAKGARVEGRGRLVVILQHGHLADLGSVVVAPLFEMGEIAHIRRLRPIVEIAGKKYLVMIDRLAALSSGQLGVTAANLESHDFELKNALDFLFSGI